MTIEEMKTIDQEFLTPAQAAAVIGCEPYAINVQAKADPGRLGFPVCMIGNRVKIPRRAFLRWLEYGDAPQPTEEQIRAALARYVQNLHIT